MSTSTPIGRASGRGRHVVIVGGGPVGLTLAHELLDTGWRITIVESGGREFVPAVQQLNVLETSGYAAAPNFESRARAVGGSAAIWNTFVDGRQAWARLVPMDERDFATSWPLTFDAVERYYARVYRACGLDDRAVDHLRRVATRGPRLGSMLHAIGELMVPAARFTVDLPRILDRAANVEVVTDRTVVALRHGAGPDGATVTAVDTVTHDGRPDSIGCDIVVLAAGGIENPRLLLQADLANDATGRYFSDHFTLPIGQFRATPEVQRALLRDLDLSESDGSFVTTKVQLRAATRAQHALLNAGMTLLPVLAPVRQHSIAATTRQAARMMVGAGTLAAIQRKPRPRLNSGHWSRVPAAEHLFEGFTVAAQIEQSPQPDNR
jgi:glycine/D-amino acid oxidase-like deaminating enzyme